jgi:hypothetical protein
MGAYLPPRCRCKSAAVALPKERRTVARPHQGRDRRDEQELATQGRESAFFSLPSFFPSPQPPVGWAYTVFNF